MCRVEVSNYLLLRYIHKQQQKRAICVARWAEVQEIIEYTKDESEVAVNKASDDYSR